MQHLTDLNSAAGSNSRKSIINDIENVPRQDLVEKTIGKQSIQSVSFAGVTIDSQIDTGSDPTVCSSRHCKARE